LPDGRELLIEVINFKNATIAALSVTIGPGTPRRGVFPPFCVATMPNWTVILKRECYIYVRVQKQFRRHSKTNKTFSNPRLFVIINLRKSDTGHIFLIAKSSVYTITKVCCELKYSEPFDFYMNRATEFGNKFSCESRDGSSNFLVAGLPAINAAIIAVANQAKRNKWLFNSLIF
jgi:hypothetical protein